jgi:hypothetical protein
MSEKPEDHFGQPINVGDNVMMRSGRKNKMRKGKVGSFLVRQALCMHAGLFIEDFGTQVEEVVLTDEQAKKRDLDHAPQV